jgi:hypothetical protein
MMVFSEPGAALLGARRAAAFFAMRRLDCFAMRMTPAKT